MQKYGIDALAEEQKEDDAELKAHIFELRMEIEEAEGLEELNILQMSVENYFEEEVFDMKIAFADADLDAVKKAIQKAKYFESTLKDIDNKKE